METIFKYLADDIQTIEQCNQAMDSASWGYEEGILITGNQAKEILKHTAQLQADKAELLEFMKELKDRFEHFNDKVSMSQIESLIQKMKQ